MDSAAVLEVMRAFFKDRVPAPAPGDFGAQAPRALLKESLDVVDFIVYLEEELGCPIDTRELGEALMNRNFGELAAELAGRLEG
jgi:hypothetical protein